MTNPQKLIPLFERTHWIIKQQTKDLSHADSLLQLPFRANTMNWVLGHVLHGRNLILHSLNLPPALDETRASRYDRESEPMTDADEAVPLATLLAALADSQTRIVAALNETSEADLAVIYNEKRQTTVGDWIEFQHWHETYHVGQLEILRQLAGTDDKII
ncbi:MAG: DinB family protein [Ardenticatenaceae bacterium]|nr:DinB family protein [Ardenticatenaceae bacterium]MCB9445979.1 DinB family protein [Ardenticatenaceae bacterium]